MYKLRNDNFEVLLDWLFVIVYATIHTKIINCLFKSNERKLGSPRICVQVQSLEVLPKYFAAAHRALDADSYHHIYIDVSTLNCSDILHALQLLQRGLLCVKSYLS